MRIGYIHVDYEEWTTGSNYNVQELGLARAWEKMGHEVYIVYWVKHSSFKCYTEVPISEHIKKTYLPALNLRHHIICNPNHLKKFRFDLLHIQSDNLFYVPEITAWCRRNQIPYYCYVGTIESSNPSKLQRIFVDLITRRNIAAFKKSIVFTKTPAVATKLKSKGVNNVKVAPVGLDLDAIPEITENRDILRSDLKMDSGKKQVVCVCALRESKRPMDVFKLAEELTEDFEITYIGNGPLRNEFEQKLKEYMGPAKIQYIPSVNNADIHKYYYCSDYFVNFNSDEIFGMAILEAMYQNCTVIARHAPGPDFIIQNRKNGYLVNSIQEMRYFLMNKKSLETSPKERVVQEFNWMKTAEKFLTAGLNISGEKNSL